MDNDDGSFMKNKVLNNKFLLQNINFVLKQIDQSSTLYDIYLSKIL